MTQNNLEEVSVVSDQYELPLVSESTSKVHTYHPTKWPLVNKLLDLVDIVSKGRAGQLQHFIKFAFLGGIASLVNIGVLYLIDSRGAKLISDANIRHAVAFVIATEIAIMVNFSLNDYFTFRHLPGHARSWKMRCLRFHMTSASGTLLTLLINALLTYKFKVPFTLAQAIGILIVLFYNFAAHHFFTYRQVKPVTV